MVFDHNAPATRVSPRHVLQQQGLSREPGGGGAVRQGDVAPGQIPPRIRGKTFPVTVSAVSQNILPRDNDRKFLFIVNNDPVGVVFVSFGNDAAINQGIRLAAVGGSALLDISVPTERVTMIGTLALNPNVSIIIG